jgi:hypothetical protein
MNKACWVICPSLVVAVVLVVLAVLGAGCRPAVTSAGGDWRLDSAKVDGRRALGQVRALVDITPRDSGSAGACSAAEHLQAELKRFVSEVELDVFTNNTPRGNMVFRNVVGMVPGNRQEIVVLISHYDTKAGISDEFQGANDSGSSSGLLLELARLLHEGPQPLPYTVMFGFLDGEECIEAYSANDGLHGSRRLVKQLQARGVAKNIKAVILLDMVGDCDLNIAIPHNADRYLRKIALEAARRGGERDKFGLASNNVLDDHVPFLEAGIPAIDLIDFEYGSKPGLNDYWHTEQDTLEHISAQSLVAVGRVVVYMLNILAE